LFRIKGIGQFAASKTPAVQESGVNDMVWDKTLETGIQKVDEQHKELFRRIELLTDTKNAKRTYEMLEFLEEYVHVHFRDEEALQAQSGYPKAAQHSAYHAAFVETIRQLKKKLQSRRHAPQ